MVERTILPNKIAEARKARGWTQGQLAARLHVTQQAVQRYETGKRDIAASTLVRLSRVLGVTVAYLLCLTDSEESGQGMVPIPLFGSIAAGTPLDMDATDETYPLPGALCSRWPNSFFLRVEGESMNRILPNGCLALVDPCTTVEYEGQPYAVCVDERAATIKRVRLLSDGLELVPDSADDSYLTQRFTHAEANRHTLSVIGRIVWHCVPFDWSY